MRTSEQEAGSAWRMGNDRVFQYHDARDRCRTAPDSIAHKPDAVGHDKRRGGYPAGHVHASYSGEDPV